MQLACPFCGSENTKIVVERGDISFSVYMQAVTCSTCGSCGPFRSNQIEAEEAWNIRDGKVLEVEQHVG